MALTQACVDGSRPHRSPLVDIRKKYQSKDIATSDRNVTAVSDADVIIMAVKPQVLNDVRALVCM